MTEAKKPPVDWEAIERDYRTGHYTDRELGARAGVSHTAIQKRAKKGEWQKDLAGAVRVATAAKMAEHALSKVVSKTVAKQVAKQVASAVPATVAVVEVLAEGKASKLIQHQDDFDKLRQQNDAMLAELASAGANAEELEQIAEVLAGSDGDKENKMRIALQKAISLPSRVMSHKSLVDARLKVIEGERVNYRLNDPETPPTDIRDLPDDEFDRRFNDIAGRLGFDAAKSSG